MSSYVAEILGPGEQLLYQGHVSLFAILGSLIGGLVLAAAGVALIVAVGPLGAIPIVLGLIWIAAALIRRSSTELAVTDRRVIAKFGFIRRSTVELNLTKIESIRVEQTVMGRIFGYGSVYVTGTGSTLDPIPFIADPIKFRQAVQQATDAIQRSDARA
ncbi:MAG TPA: PH domain-containing protein [Casimicrobiaceae bacterium]|nr:PH domain-containing protein [Casimicrobiaceae bacterium]